MFALNIPVTSASLDTIKAELTRTMSGVKSSHRCEAIARGLDYRTYAAFLAATRAPIADHATAQGSAFSGYLAEHGFNAPLLAFYHAVTRVARQAVLERMPKLTMRGIGVGAPSLKSDDTRENWKDLAAKFDKQRADLLGDRATELFLLALAFVSRVERTKTIRSDADSYRLKHMTEKYAGTFPEGGKLGPQYVTNGILIAAAVQALPALNDDIAITRVELDRPGGPPALLSDDQRRARTTKGIEHDIAALRAIANGVGYHRHRFYRRVHGELISAAGRD